jgi:membrane protease YdiL (CAAX protease family)
MLNYLPFILLFLTVLSLWLPAKSGVQPWKPLLLLSLISGIYTGAANIIAVTSIVILYGLISIYGKASPRVKPLFWLLNFALAFTLELHLIPGFHNLLILDKVKITADAMPYTLYLNFDKTIAGLLIIGLTLQRVKSLANFKLMLKQVFVRLPLVLLIILILSYAFGYVRFEPKLAPQLWLWMISNLFFTCIAEEGLFRGFFQEYLSSFKYKYAEYVAIVIPALFFGAIHFPGGIKYVILATVAGSLYGWIYKVTCRIEASMLAHFTLNLTHILFFTYPALVLH